MVSFKCVYCHSKNSLLEYLDFAYVLVISNLSGLSYLHELSLLLTGTNASFLLFLSFSFSYKINIFSGSINSCKFFSQ